MEIIIISFLALFSFLAIKRIDLAVFSIVFLLPIYLIRFSFFSIPLTLLEGMILISFFSWLIKELPSLKNRLVNKEKKIEYPFKWEIILLLILSFVAVAVAGFSFSALGVWKAYFFEPIMLFILLVNILRNNKERKKIFIALSFSVLMVSLFAIYQKISGNFIPNDFWAESSTRRVVSFFSYPNAVGLFLAPLISLFLGIACFYRENKEGKRKNILSVYFFVLILLGILSIIFARSDGALIAFLFSLFVFLFFYTKKSRILGLILIFIFLTSVFAYKPLGEAVYTRVSFSDLSGQIRLQQWRETMQTFKGRSFVLGNGLSSYQEAVEPYHQEGIFFNYDGLENFDAVVWASPALRDKYWQPVEIYLYPHNIFLNFWTEIGLFGAILFLWLLFKSIFISFNIFLKNLKIDKEKACIAIGLGLSFLAIFIHGLVDVPYFKNDLSAMFFVLLALLGSLKVEMENS